MTAAGRAPDDAVDLDDLGPDWAEMSECERESYGRTPLRLTLSELDAGRTPRPFPAVHIMRGPPPAPPAMLVSGWAVDADITLLTGPGGHAKSPLLLMTAVCVAVDRPLFGTLPLARSGPVLLVLPEDGASAARMMLDAIADGLELQAGERTVLADRLVMVTDETRVNLTTAAAQLRDTALEHGAVLVCGDPIRNMLGGADENDNGIAGEVCDSLRREVCRKAGAAVMLTHHHRKPAKDAAADAEPSRYDVRGGGGWVDGSRLALGVRKHAGRITVTSLKANRIANNLRHELDLAIEADERNEAHWSRLTVTDANAGASSLGASSQALTPGVGRPINPNEQKALEAIDDQHEPGRRVSWSEWKRSAGMSEDTLKSVKRRLLDAALAVAHEAGQHRNGGKTYAYSISETRAEWPGNRAR